MPLDFVRKVFLWARSRALPLQCGRQRDPRVAGVRACCDRMGSRHELQPHRYHRSGLYTGANTMTIACRALILRHWALYLPDWDEVICAWGRFFQKTGGPNIVTVDRQPLP